MTSLVDAIDVWRRAVVAELSWRGDDGPAAIAIVPLVLDGRPCAALPYHRVEEVVSLADGAVATWTVTDPRGPAGTPGVRFTGTVTVRDDLDGNEFTDHLLDQELRRHPPSRLRADSAMQRREHWWWLPRRIVQLTGPTRTSALPRRTGPEGALLVTEDVAAGVVVTPVEVAGTVPSAAGTRTTVRRLDGDPVRGAAEPALLMGHDYLVPDLSRWSTWRRWGELRGDGFEVARAEGAPELELAPSRLRDRLRDERAVARGCRQGLRWVQLTATRPV